MEIEYKLVFGKQANLTIWADGTLVGSTKLRFKQLPQALKDIDSIEVNYPEKMLAKYLTRAGFEFESSLNISSERSRYEIWTKQVS
ncbi:hypothetical protein [Enterococcus sp. AZ196]|uniref:hypothetical protein n=1 Tax=Enterococcus sp. AZ196 TaxID=2774659 RepID=UPI003D2DD957